MTIFQALFIKWLRVKQEGSWRYVSAKYQQRYIDKTPYKEEIMTVNGNQLHGLDLCEQAMKVLNETIEQGWN